MHKNYLFVKSKEKIDQKKLMTKKILNKFLNNQKSPSPDLPFEMH